MRGVDRLPHAVGRAWHQMGVCPQREPRVMVAEVLTQCLTSTPPNSMTLAK
jgi:hypothetical protein